MKLYYSPASTASLPIVLFCAEQAIPLELSLIDLMTGQQKSPDYLKLNPWGLVPVLDDDGFVLTESSTILKYVADKVASRAYPRELRARATVNERMDWINTEVYRELGYQFVYPQILPHHARSPETVQNATLTRGRERACRALGILDRHVIGDHAYLCGDALTIADYFAAQILHVGSLVGASYDAYPNLARWHATMKALPHWQPVNAVYDGMGASLSSKTFLSLSA
ncbi:MAG: glutathione S-transferase family protein [Myxococcales bacterium]|jgi:glutathione S-transferase